MKNVIYQIAEVKPVKVGYVADEDATAGTFAPVLHLGAEESPAIPPEAFYAANEGMFSEDE